MDIGKLSFICSSINGYGVMGRPLNHAKRLSTLTTKYSCRMLVSHDVAAEAASLFSFRSRGRLIEESGGVERAFYEVIGRL